MINNKNIDIDKVLNLYGISENEPQTFVDFFKNKIKKENKINNNDLEEKLWKANKCSEDLINNLQKVTLLNAKIQSGKTTLCAAIVAYMFDKKSNLAIIIPSVSNILLEQTKEAMSIFSNKAKIFDIKDLYLKDNNNFQELNDALQGPSNKKVILIVLKQSKRLKQLIDLLKSNFKNIIKYPFVIEDESDQGSFNTNATSKNKNPTIISSKMEELLISHKTISLLSVTATAAVQTVVANDCLMKPEKVVFAPAGNKYFDLSDFVKNPKYHYEFPDDDIKVILNEKISELPLSLKRAILNFFIFAIKITSLNNKCTSQFMIININSFKKNHEIIKNKVKQFISEFLSDDTSLQYINKIILEILNENNDYDLSNNFIILKDFVQKIRCFVNKIVETNVINGDADSGIVEIHKKDNKFHIYIGANILGRGLALNDLSISYFGNHPKSGKMNSDTLLQEARWLGYKEYKDLVKIYISKKCFEEFIKIESAYSNSDKNIIKYENENSNFKESPREFLLNNSINPTKKGITSYEYINKRTKSSLIAKNEEISEYLFNKIKNDNNTKKIIENQNFLGKEFNNFNDFLKWANIFKEDSIKFKNSDIFFNFINSEKFKKIIETNCSICIANMYTKDEEKDYREHTINENGEISALLQGRPSPWKEDMYIGDEYWTRDIEKYKNTLIIQLQKILINKKNETIKNINKNNFIYKLVLKFPTIKNFNEITIGIGKYRK